MTPQRSLGIALIVIGLILLGVGLTSTDSLADRVHETLTGRYTQRTMTWILGGIGTSVVGLLMVLIRFGKPRA